MKTTSSRRFPIRRPNLKGTAKKHILLYRSNGVGVILKLRQAWVFIPLDAAEQRSKKRETRELLAEANAPIGAFRVSERRFLRAAQGTRSLIKF